MRISLFPKFFNRASRIVTALALVATLTAQSRLDVSQAKGIYRDGGAARNSTGNTGSGRAAIAYELLVQDGREWVNVGPNYEFRSGDRFKIRFQSNRDGYIYVLNRTFNGDPNQLASKGIERVRTEDQQRRPDGPTYRLIYPIQRDGNKVTANRWVVLPGSDSLVMDDRPGVEKLYFIVSSKPLRLGDHFNVETGELRTQRRQSARNDSDDDVLNQLNKELAAYAQNSEVAALETKGIIREGDAQNYGVVRDGSKPAQFEVSLRHLPR